MVTLLVELAAVPALRVNLKSQIHYVEKKKLNYDKL